MKITKFSHACFVAEVDGKALVVDPGVFSGDYTPYDNVVGIVVTHEHADHLDKAALEAIMAHNPSAIIYGPTAVTDTLTNFPVQAVSAGDTVMNRPFELTFFGGEHADIHATMPVPPNVGVMINDTLYYPGDSFTNPGRPVKVLALPAAAPWMKLSEAMDFVSQLKPERAFPTHDAVLSEVGQSMTDSMLGAVAEKAGVSYERLVSGQSLKL